MRKLYYGIGEVAKLVGISVAKIDYWEQVICKLHSAKLDNRSRDQRRFNQVDVQRIVTINALSKTKKYTLKGIKDILIEINFYNHEQL